jgi:hypothetical protein
MGTCQFDHNQPCRLVPRDRQMGTYRCWPPHNLAADSWLSDLVTWWPTWAYLVDRPSDHNLKSLPVLLFVASIRGALDQFSNLIQSTESLNWSYFLDSFYSNIGMLELGCVGVWYLQLSLWTLKCWSCYRSMCWRWSDQHDDLETWRHSLGPRTHRLVHPIHVPPILFFEFLLHYLCNSKLILGSLLWMFWGLGALLCILNEARRKCS